MREKRQSKDKAPERSSFELLLKDLNSHLQQYLSALKTVTENNEYHHLAR